MKKEQDTREVLKLLKKLMSAEIVDFDITINADSEQIDKIARFCGKEGTEFWIYEDITKKISRKLIRIRD